jgi:hypothetical protein
MFMTQENRVRSSSAGFFPVRSRLLQRECSCGGSGSGGGECEECKKKTLQRWAAGLGEPAVAPPIVHEVLRSPGQPLDAATRAFMEPRFGHDFSKVRLHTDEKAAESARSVHALAYTVGSDIVLGDGAFRPRSDRGRGLLAHELAHVVQQQGQSALTAGPDLAIGTPGDRFEAEADRISGAVMSARPPAAFGFRSGFRRDTASAASRGLASGGPAGGVQRSSTSYLARVCLNPDICAAKKTKKDCDFAPKCGYGKSGVCSWLGITDGCCCLGASEREPLPVPAPAPKTAPDDSERKVREKLPSWVVPVLVSLGLMAAVAACFLSGFCEAAILVGAPAAVAVAVIAALRGSGVKVNGGATPSSA